MPVAMETARSLATGWAVYDPPNSADERQGMWVSRNSLEARRKTYEIPEKVEAGQRKAGVADFWRFYYFWNGIFQEVGLFKYFFFHAPFENCHLAKEL